MKKKLIAHQNPPTKQNNTIPLKISSTKLSQRGTMVHFRALLPLGFLPSVTDCNFIEDLCACDSENFGVCDSVGVKKNSLDLCHVPQFQKEKHWQNQFPTSIIRYSLIMFMYFVSFWSFWDMLDWRSIIRVSSCVLN